MPNRIIKESITTSATIDKLTDAEEAFFYRLLTRCDDYGRYDGRLPVIRALCYPLRLAVISDEEVLRRLIALENAGLIYRYVIGEVDYLQVVTWDKHQQIRAKRSRFPEHTTSDIKCYQLIADDINSYQISNDIKCPPADLSGKHVISNVPVIQSNPVVSECVDENAPTPLFDENTGKKAPKQKAVKTIDTSNPVPDSYPFYQAFWQFSLDVLGKPLCSSDVWDKGPLSPDRIEALMKELDTKAQKAYSTSGLQLLNQYTIRPKHIEELKARYPMGTLQTYITYAIQDCNKEITKAASGAGGNGKSKADTSIPYDGIECRLVGPEDDDPYFLENEKLREAAAVKRRAGLI